jgi:hypothetical protein
LRLIDNWGFQWPSSRQAPSGPCISNPAAYFSGRLNPLSDAAAREQLSTLEKAVPAGGQRAQVALDAAQDLGALDTLSTSVSQGVPSALLAMWVNEGEAEAVNV